MTKDLGNNFGVLGATVWPPYIGATTGDPGSGPTPLNEPSDDFNYRRGQITWRTLPNGLIVGSAEIYVPKGIYTHFVFCNAPVKEMMMGKRKFEYPEVYDRPMIIVVDPIHNDDVLPRLPA